LFCCHDLHVGLVQFERSVLYDTWCSYSDIDKDGSLPGCYSVSIDK